MMALRNFFTALVLSLLLTLNTAGRSTATTPASSLLDDELRTTIASTPERLSITVDVPAYELDVRDLDGATFNLFSLKEQNGWSGTPGGPQIPVYSLMIAAPPEAAVQLTTLSATPTLLAGSFRLPPVPSPVPGGEELVAGASTYDTDPIKYGQNTDLPGVPARIAGEAWVRGQRILRIELYPIQYNPARGSVAFIDHFELQVTFSGDSTSSNCTNCAFDAELEATLARNLLNYEQGKSWRIAPGSDAMIEQLQSPIVSTFLGDRYEILVDQDGVYHLTYSDLQAAGMAVNTVNPQTFRMLNQGQDIAIYVAGEGDGSFDPGDYIAFYGEDFRGDIMAARYQSTMTKAGNIPNDAAYAANNWFWQCVDSCELDSYFERYEDQNTYYLLEGGSPGPRMASVDGTPGGATVPAYYMETVHAEESNHWYPNEWYDDDVWMWRAVSGVTTSEPFSVTLSAVASVPISATIHAEITAENHDINNSPDHHTQLRFNGVLFDDATWDGRIRHYADGTVPISSLVNGSNAVTLTIVGDTGFTNEKIHFDFYEVTYPRLFQAVNDALGFTYNQAGTWNYQVSGLTSSTVEVYDISDPFNPKRVLNPGVSGGGGNFTASFQVTHGAQAAYIAAGTGIGVLSPVSISAYNPPDFAGMAPADYVLITHKNFITSTQTLASYRAGQGYSVAMIDVNDLYHEFNDGIEHPIAIKNFIAWTFANWPEGVVYVGLVGDGNWNMLNFGDGTKTYHNAPPSYMPPNLAYVDPWQGEVDSSNLLATVVGDDTMPDVYISRFPVKTDAEMATIVGKITAYEAAAFSNWHKNILFIADNVPDQAGNFINLSEGIITDYLNPNPLYQPLRIYQDDGNGIPNGNDFGCIPGNTAECDALTQAIIDTINITGTLITNYTGHASLNRWSSEQIFVNADVASLNNASMQPFIMSMTCLDGHWTYPNIDSLVYLLLTTPNKGAVATFSATGLGVATGHDYLQRGFYESLMEDGVWEIGPATVSGKLELWGSAQNYDLMQTFMVFGDPALGIRDPYAASLTPPTAAQSGAAGTDVVYNLTVRNTGLATDTYDVTVSAGNWPAYASTLSVGPLGPNLTSQIQITVTVPLNALNNQTDQTTVQVISRGNSKRTDSSQLTTTATSSGILLTPPNSTLFGAEGENLNFTLTITNTSINSETYNVTLSGDSWPNSAPTQVGPVPSGGSTNFIVTVTVPMGVTPGDQDAFTVQVTAQSNPGISASSNLTAIASGGEIFLPIVFRD